MEFYRKKVINLQNQVSDLRTKQESLQLDVDTLNEIVEQKVDVINELEDKFDRIDRDSRKSFWIW